MRVRGPGRAAGEMNIMRGPARSFFMHPASIADQGCRGAAGVKGQGVGERRQRGAGMRAATSPTRSWLMCPVTRVTEGS